MHQTVRVFYFSPTGGVRRVARALGSALAKAPEFFDLSDQDVFIPKADGELPAVFAVPVFAGRVPAPAREAVRRIAGVKDARQYTVPVPAALEAVRAGRNPALTTREKHPREVYVVTEEGADRARIEREIKEMPNYFSDYDTTVHFIDADTLAREHAGLPHGGFVIRSGETGAGNRHIIEYRLQLDSNPEFTGAVLTAYARAAYRMAQEGMSGAKTVFDIAPAYLSARTGEELRARML